MLEYSTGVVQTRSSQKYSSTLNRKEVLTYSWFSSFFVDFRYDYRKAPSSPDQTTIDQLAYQNTPSRAKRRISALRNARDLCFEW